MNFYKFDLNEPYTEAKLSFINPKFRKEIMKRLAIMKVLYVEGSFSQEEKVIVQDWLKQFPVPQATLKERFTSYLRQFFPHTAATNELLGLIG